MKNAAYWQRRFEAIENMKTKAGENVISDMEHIFVDAQRELESKISVWYQRFADNNEISLTEAKRWLNNNQLAEFKWDVNEYIRIAKENTLNQQWVRQLENASARVHISRLEALKLQTQQTVEKLFGNQLDAVDALLRQQYLDGFYHSVFEVQRGFGVGWDFASIDERQLTRVISKPWTADNRTFSDRIWQDKARLVNEVHTQLSRGLMIGASPNELITDLQKAMNTSRHNAARLIMTESTYFSSLAEYDAYRELDVERYQILATLDKHTSDICAELDGKVFRVTDYQPGVTAPPFHPNCRTTTVPYFEDNFGERFARDAEGRAVYVPSDMGFAEWKEKFLFNASRQDVEQFNRFKSVLGKNAPKSIDKFFDLKYNDSENWGTLMRNYELFKKIDNTTVYSAAYKQKLKDAYLWFREHGYEFTEHALNRVVSPKVGSGKRTFGFDDVLDVLRLPVNYVDGENKHIRFHNGFAAVQAIDTEEIMSFVDRGFKVNDRWERL